ncbi:cytochrome P450 [Streptomyces sp. NBC_00271]|uniref:cytochrome P450 n=1 Tax=Streptomyces sp. NBC_00271 TaxID=2975697 RepID=UPI002E2C4659|nr:cytochrome P450 [Streptomyces sp. NBC_00271]
MTSDPAVGAVPPPGCPAHSGAGVSSRTPLYKPEFAADPVGTYAALRRFGPVVPVELAPGVEASMVIGYETALRVLRDPGTFSKDPRRWRALAEGTIGPDSPVMPMMEYRPSCMFTEGEEHRRRRAVVDDSLKRVDPLALRTYVETTADTLIDSFQEAGEADLLSNYAAVLPLLVLTRMIGCPAAYGERLFVAMRAIFEAGADAKCAHGEALQCLNELIAFKRATPGPDVISWMMAHPVALTDEEMVHELSVLFGAGTEPEQNLIANVLRLLLSDDRFAGSLSGGSLPIEDALDEVLWKDPPMANYCVHYPVHDVVLEGTRLRQGDPVIISLAAANNDPAQASNHRVGNRAHLAWSAGPHACPAQGSARLIATVAIEKLLDRLPDVELVVPVAELKWRPGPFHRALTALPVRFEPVKDSAWADRLPDEAPRSAPSPASTPVMQPSATHVAPDVAAPHPIVPDHGGWSARRIWERLIGRQQGR